MSKTYKLGSFTKVTPAYAAAITINPANTRTQVSLNLTGNTTLNIGVNAQRTPGDKLILVAKSDATARTVTFGTGFTAPALVGVISKTRVQEFIYDEALGFIPSGAAVQID
jgi:hypothetical protein